MVNSLENAILEAQKIGNEEAFVIGGAEIYRLALPKVDKIYLTEVHHVYEGDTFFPVIDKTIWKETHRENFEIDEKHSVKYSFVELEK